MVTPSTRASLASEWLTPAFVGGGQARASLLPARLVLGCLAAALLIGCSDDSATGGGGSSGTAGGVNAGGANAGGTGQGGAATGGASATGGAASGGGGASTGTGEFAVLFPPASSLTDAPSIPVHGTAETGTQSVSVEGVAATGNPTLEDWLSNVPLSPGTQSLSVDLVGPDGMTVSPAATLQVERNALPVYPRRLDLDLANGRAFVGDLGAVYEVDLASGQRRVVSGYTATGYVGQGDPFLVQITGLAWDPVGDRLLVVDYEQLFSVDVTTGDRTVVSNGSGDFPTSPSGDIALDGDRVLVGGFGEIAAVDLATGVSTTITSSSVGSGSNLGAVEGLAVDAANDRVLVQAQGSLVSVALATGNRTVLSSPFVVGNGPGFAGLSTLAADFANGRVFTTMGGPTGWEVGAVDLASGDRSLVGFSGNGPTRMLPRGLRWDGTRVLTADELMNGLLSVDVVSGDRAIVSAGLIGAGEHLVYPALLAHDDLSDRLVVATSNTIPIFAGLPFYTVDPVTGAREVVADNGVGSGPYFTALGMEARGGVVYAAGIGQMNLPAIVTVDLATGDRALLTQNGDGLGDDFGANPSAVAFDPGGSLFTLVTKPDQSSSVFEVDPQSGTRTLRSSAQLGAGAPLVGACDLAHDGTRLLVVETQQLVAVDPVTGDRTTVSGAGIGSGPALGGCDAGGTADSWLAPDGTLYVLQNSRIVAVDLGSGDRVLLSANTDGNGPSGYQWAGLDGDAAGRLFMTERALGVTAVDMRSGARAILSR